MYREKYPWIYDLLFLLVFALAGYLRLTGVTWGEGQHQHPDENFLSGVLAGLQAQKCADESIPVEACPPDQRRWLGIGDYFDSKTSTLNPYNRGYSFFVYGNLPMTIVRVAADAMQEYDVKMLGRQFSALADLFTILLLYLAVSRLYNKRVALLACLFSALTVMQIQQSHFFTTDLFVNAFAFLAIYFAVKILDVQYSETEIRASNIETREPEMGNETALEVSEDESQITNYNSRIKNYALRSIHNPLFLLSIGFGFAFGMALASKVNIYPLAVLLPAAFLVRHLIQNRDIDIQSLKSDYWTLVLACLVAGGLAAIISFRIFQPYAFDGLGINQQWIANIQEQRVQAKGDADLPWNLQWARRSSLYSFENLTRWGLGLPLGILAWAGFLLMGWRVFKGEWRHALLWGWTALYFLWQSLQFNPTMRYQLPIYPLLAMMAAWFVFEVAGLKVERLKGSRVPAVLAGVVGISVVALTAVWAFAFHSIYLREEPRIAASRWIFQNVPGPINVHIQTNGNGTYNQPLPFPTGVNIQPAVPYQTSFIAQNDGLLKEILLAHVVAYPKETPSQLYLTVWQNLNDAQPLASTVTVPSSQDLSADLSQVANFDQGPALAANQTYYLKFEMTSPRGRVNVCGALRIFINSIDQTTEQLIDASAPCTVTTDSPYMVPFVPQVDGILDEIVLEHIADPGEDITSEPQALRLFISREPNPTSEQSIASTSLTETFASSSDPRGDSYTLTLDQPVAVERGAQYYLSLEVGSGVLSLSGASVSNETDYDYGLPFRVDGYDAFGGIYRGDLTLQVYWDDNEEKLNRYVDILNQTDYIFIPTNHQYAQITRLPERYPLTTLYYRELIGCPHGENIIECYHEAKPGDYEGRLGFDLVAVFETFPKLGSFEINDQYAEEAFTFYDHPKVLIFRKSDNFNIAQVRDTLTTVDLTKAVHLTPRQFDDYSTLMLPEDTLAQQRAGGTWSQLFDYDWVQNKYPVLGILIWYLFIFILGLAVYPLVRFALPGLADKGYPLSRALGLVLLGYLAWIGGSTGIPYTRTTIAIVFGLIVLLGLGLAWVQRAELREEWRTKRRYFLLIEGLFLAFFLVDLIIRLGNPDLWHPAKGGERPMDFSYFNAVIKSTFFPPYDPWFAGGYINYYYYGFVLVGTPVKLLGIVPSIAYNFILPTLFGIVGICAFSVGWNLLSNYYLPITEDKSSQSDTQPLIAGLAASAFTLLLGNLGTVQLIFQKLQQIGAGGAFEWDPAISIFQRWTWAIQGFSMVLKGTPLAIGYGDWYWNPSRVVPPLGGNEITEFPLFTFVYSDLHAHMIAMPLALLALSWALAIVAGRAKWPSPFSAALGFAVGGLIIGALYPSNLSDMYTYLPVGLFALGYAIWRYADTSSPVRRLGLAVGAVFALTFLSFMMYQPYRDSYSQVYSALDPWKGPFTPFGSYLTHWTVLLFVVVSWMAWETREWMAETPVSALAKLKPYRLLIEGFLVLIVFALLALQYLGPSVGWVALPIAAWAGVLLLRPNLSDTKRFVLFLIGTALIITIVVEVVVVRGDIGRQNTIFKFYLQSWFLLAVSAGAALAWTIPAFFKWLPGWRAFWQTGMILLISGAALFTISGTSGKIRDRWIVEAPRTLDAMTFMKYAHYDDFGQRLDLSEDYYAIRWMQDNVQGSPVIVEANCPEYRWCTRFTIYTGLPGVVGWNWHQRQQRGFMSTWVEDRVTEVGNFYNSIDVEYTRAFLEEYDVSYIIVGPLERAAYTPEGIAKFDAFEGIYWRAAYRDGDTAIYEVILQIGE
jgi:YYY domain-containing protein